MGKGRYKGLGRIRRQNWASKDTTHSWKIMKVPALETSVFSYSLEIRKSVRSRMGYFSQMQIMTNFIRIFLCVDELRKQNYSSTYATDCFDLQFLYATSSSNQSINWPFWWFWIASGLHKVCLWIIQRLLVDWSECIIQPPKSGIMGFSKSIIAWYPKTDFLEGFISLRLEQR